MAPASADPLNAEAFIEIMNNLGNPDCPWPDRS
jgi:hypothetical protein